MRIGAPSTFTYKYDNAVRIRENKKLVSETSSVAYMERTRTALTRYNVYHSTHISRKDTKYKQFTFCAETSNSIVTYRLTKHVLIDSAMGANAAL